MRLVGGYFVFDSPDASLLVSLLPTLVHMRGAERLSTLVKLVCEEAVERNPDGTLSCHALSRCFSSRRSGHAGQGCSARTIARIGRRAIGSRTSADARRPLADLDSI